VWQRTLKSACAAAHFEIRLCGGALWNPPVWQRTYKKGFKKGDEVAPNSTAW